jgi:hypothetical protein
MDLETVIKVITLVAAMIGAGKIFYDADTGRRTRNREEYLFAKKFLLELHGAPPLHPFLKEKGYQAIAGDSNVTSAEVEYLLSLQHPDTALRDYVLGKNYVEHLPKDGNHEMAFRGRYRHTWYRGWLKIFYFIMYFVSIFFALVPFLFFRELFKAPTKSPAPIIILCILVFGPMAWFMLREITRIVRAERLVQRQQKHTQTVLGC